METRVGMESVVGAEGAENAESGEGFSESGTKKKGDGDLKKSQQNQQQIAKIKANIAKKQQVSDRKISRVAKVAIHREMRQVEKQVKKFSRNATKNAFALACALEKLRKLRFILKNLAHWTMDFLRKVLERIREKKQISQMNLPQS